MERKKRARAKWPSQLDDNQIVKAVSIFKRADTVELKLTVSDSDRASGVKALDMDVLDAEFRQVVFFDTPGLDLNHGGMVLRARRVRKGGDAVVKLRPLLPDDVPKELRLCGGFSIEVDVMPGSYICSGSLKSRVDNADVREVLHGKRPIRKLFHSQQESLYKEHAPADLDLDSLLPFGPINVAKMKFSPPDFDRLISAELWFYPDGSRILELSTKCAHDRAFQVMAETRAFLARHGIDVSGDQETKTHKALEYFADIYRKTKGGKKTRRETAVA